MANIQSNIKRHNQSKQRNVLVHSQNSKMKTLVKKAKNNKDKNSLSIAYATIDSNLSKGIITKNKANRLKSRLAIFVNKSSVEQETDVKKTKKITKKTSSKKTLSSKSPSKKTSSKKSLTTGKKAASSKTVLAKKTKK